MATVRFSQELRDKILVSANNLFSNDINKASEVPDGLGDLIYDLAYAPYVPAMNALPKEFFYTIQGVVVKRIDDTEYNTPRLSFRTGARPVAESCNGINGLNYKANYSREDWTLTGGVWSEVKQELDARKQRIAQALEKQKAFKESVSQIIYAYETLSPALKAWQPLWDLVPEEAKERHRKVVERTKNEVVLDVNLDIMTAQVIKAKLIK